VAGIKIKRGAAATATWLKALSRKHRKLVILTNIAGFCAGLIYYAPQIARFPVHSYIFIIDSPVAALCAGASLLLRSQHLQRFTSIINIKYGLWTLLVLALFSPEFLRGTSIPMYLFLAVSHLGMLLQGIALAPRTGSMHGLFGSAILVLVNDFSDYFSYFTERTHSILPFQQFVNGSFTHPPQHSIAGLAAGLSTAVALISVRYISVFCQTKTPENREEPASL
jgi:uncharacterized membrane protein YpjA